MGKYIIEIEDENIDGEFYKAKGFIGLIFDKEGLNKLEKYEEPKEEKVSGRWKPAINEDYWYLSGAGDAHCTDNCNYAVDKLRFAIGNYFKNKKEAEFEIERLKVIAELKKFAESDDVWNGETNHYYLYFSVNSGEILIDYNTHYNRADIYFTSKEIAQKAIETVGEDRIKKYYLRIKE